MQLAASGVILSASEMMNTRRRRADMRPYVGRLANLLHLINPDRPAVPGSISKTSGKLPSAIFWQAGAFAARLDRSPLAVDGLGEEQGQPPLPDALRPAEDERIRDPALFQGEPEDLLDPVVPRDGVQAGVRRLPEGFAS